jgi:hypothetical protein
MDADRIHIDPEEDGFHLLVKTEEGEWHDFRIQDCAEALHEQVNLIIGSWLREREGARLAFLCIPDESAGLAYDANDPKSPNYHSLHTNLWDAREKT